MNLSLTGERLIKSFESLRLTAYQDQKGIWTCGWGHTGRDVVEGTTCDAALAETWFQMDTAAAVAGVNHTVRIPISQNEFDALASFTFNVGVGNEAHSTLVTYVNQSNFSAAGAEFPKWDHINGVPNAGLLRRRMAEQSLFLA